MKKSKGTVVVFFGSTALQRRQDMKTRWEASVPLRSLKFIVWAGERFLQPHFLFLRPLVKILFFSDKQVHIRYQMYYKNQ